MKTQMQLFAALALFLLSWSSGAQNPLGQGPTLGGPPPKNEPKTEQEAAAEVEKAKKDMEEAQKRHEEAQKRLEEIRKQNEERADKKARNLRMLDAIERLLQGQNLTPEERQALTRMRDIIRQRLRRDPRQDTQKLFDDAAREARLPRQLIDRIKELIRQITGGTVRVSAAKGTGETTGHIATISVTNENPFPVAIVPQDFFIPSNGRDQSYVGRIPEGIIIPPGTTTDIPVDGVCTDVTHPPVPNGDPMDPSTWIPVGEPAYPDDLITPDPSIPVDEDEVPDGPVPVIVLTHPPVPKFEPGFIPVMTNTPGYTPSDETAPEVIATWPGTDIPVGGTFDPGKDPITFAPIAVEAWKLLEEAADVIQDSDVFGTPFSNNPPRERESIIQQTVWWYTAAITDHKYEQEDFAGKVYEQFEDATFGRTVSALPEEQKEQIDAGISDFWNTFMATGVEAKVISAESPGLSIQVQQDASAHLKQCKCEGINAKITLTNETRKSAIEEELKNLEQKLTTIKLSDEEEQRVQVLNRMLSNKVYEEDRDIASDITSRIAETGDQVTVSVRATNISSRVCHCTNETGQAPDCVFKVKKVADGADVRDTFKEGEDDTARYPRYWYRSFSVKAAPDNYLKFLIEGHCEKPGCETSATESRTFQITFSK